MGRSRRGWDYSDATQQRHQRVKDILAIDVFGHLCPADRHTSEFDIQARLWCELRRLGCRVHGSVRGVW